MNRRQACSQNEGTYRVLLAAFLQRLQGPCRSHRAEQARVRQLSSDFAESRVVQVKERDGVRQVHQEPRLQVPASGASRSQVCSQVRQKNQAYSAVNQAGARAEEVLAVSEPYLYWEHYHLRAEVQL